MISVTELASWVNADLTTAGVVSRLANLEAAAVAHVERVTGRHFGPVESVTEIIRGNDACRGRLLYLRDLPAEVGGATTVTIEYGAIDADVLEADTDFLLRQSGTEAWLERTDGARWSSHYEYHVTYDRGYLPGAEPEEIRAYVLGWVAERWSLRGREGVLSESIGGYSISLTSRITDRGHLDALIAQWRRPVVA